MKKSAPENNCTISVLIPVRNGEKTLSACLSSVLSQDIPPLEIIVVDNASGDGTKRIIEDFATRNSEIRYVFEEKRGRGHARNAGVRVARGDIIAMTDCDCVVPHDWLSRIVGPILTDGEDAVMGFQKDAVNNYWSREQQKENERFIRSKIGNKYIPHLDTKNFAIRGTLMKEFMFNPELIGCEDWDLFLRLGKHEIKIRFLPDVVVDHFHDASLRELWNTQFVRGMSIGEIFSMHKDDPEILKYMEADESAESRKLMNFIMFVPLIISLFIKDPGHAPYQTIADGGWRAGFVFGILKARPKIARISLRREQLDIQMETKELCVITDAIRPPVNFLVFGLGNDSIFWHEVNKNGRTVFVEDDVVWFDSITKKYPHLESYLVSYGTKAKEWKDLINHPEKLGLALPSSVTKTQWDVILVDGPAGYTSETPGRMKSIYEASRLVKNGGIIFIHDSERDIERSYGEKYLGKENMREEICGRALLRKYVISKNSDS
jgi:glucuronoxylan 4-O-methyltransferase